MNAFHIKFYCEVIEIHTTQEGYYIITIDSNDLIEESVYENKDNFTLLNPEINLITTDKNKNECSFTFSIGLYRPVNSSFILVVRKISNVAEGVFSMTVDGPSDVTVKRILGMYVLSSRTLVISCFLFKLIQLFKQIIRQLSLTKVKNMVIAAADP